MICVSSCGGQSSVVVKRPHCYHGDVGSNPTTTRNENQTLGDPPTEGSPRVWTGSKWKTGDVKAELDLYKKKKKKKKKKIPTRTDNLL